ncbi:MAG: hypothetical protein POELPBGB_01341 [Bacteroidia bacterium]|nr:hypothetical protein [Bacteroidia bacterium]
MGHSDMQILTAILIAVPIVLYFILRRQKKNLHSNWAQLLAGMKHSSMGFYDLVEKELTSKKVPDIRIIAVHLKEGGLFSPTRLYMRIVWKEYVYDVCAAPFAEGMFVSWWLYTKPTILERIMDYALPFIGRPLYHRLFPVTFYSIDTASMFMTYVQGAVLNVVDSIVKEQGLRALSETERTPKVKDIFQRV